MGFAPVPDTFRVGSVLLLGFVNFIKTRAPVLSSKLEIEAIFALVEAAVSQTA